MRELVLVFLYLLYVTSSLIQSSYFEDVRENHIQRTRA